MRAIYQPEAPTWSGGEVEAMLKRVPELQLASNHKRLQQLLYDDVAHPATSVDGDEAD